MLILTLDGLVPLTSFLTAQYLGKEEDENEDDREFLGTNPQQRATSQQPNSIGIRAESASHSP